MNLLELFGLKPSNKRPSFTRFKLSVYGASSDNVQPFYKAILESSETEANVGDESLAGLFDMLDTLLKAASTNYEADSGALRHLFNNLIIFDLGVIYDVEYIIKEDKKPWHFKSTSFNRQPPSTFTVLLADDTVDGLVNKIDDSKNLIKNLE